MSDVSKRVYSVESVALQKVFQVAGNLTRVFGLLSSHNHSFHIHTYLPFYHIYISVSQLNLFRHTVELITHKYQ